MVIWLLGLSSITAGNEARDDYRINKVQSSLNFNFEVLGIHIMDENDPLS